VLSTAQPIAKSYRVEPIDLLYRMQFSRTYLLVLSSPLPIIRDLTHGAPLAIFRICRADGLNKLSKQPHRNFPIAQPKVMRQFNGLTFGVWLSVVATDELSLGDADEGQLVTSGWRHHPVRAGV
jgi:hypothetical protein